jgi:hypothetical protein
MTNTPDPHATPGEGTSHGEGTPQPAAWAVLLADGQRIYDVYGIEEEAKAIDEAVTGNHGIVPLYRSPTLTDEEREAIGAAACICEDAGRTDIAVIINTALERLG